MNKDNVFKSSQFFMDIGDVLHILLKDEVGKPTMALYGEVDVDNPESEIIEDYDGNVYTCVTIGTQQWLLENLRSTHYADGTVIPNLILAVDWLADVTGAYCWYNNDIANKNTYGALYNWYAVNNIHGLAPTGWRVPSLVDLQTLIAFLGGDAVAGHKLREIGTTHWTAPNIGATNSSGFTAVGGGYRNNLTGLFQLFKDICKAWSSTVFDPLDSWNIWFTEGSPNIQIDDEDNPSGLTVRCIRDI